MNPLQLPTRDLEQILQGVSGWEALRGQRLLLTGGTGFIGKWLLGSFLHVNRALDLRARIVVLSRDVSGFQNRHPDLAGADDIEWLQGDVRDFSLSQPCALAIHAATDVAASQTPTEIFDTCLRGTARVMEQMRSGGGRMLQVSSGAVYGTQPHSLPRMPEDWLGGPDCLSPSSAYGEGKRAAELLCAMSAAEHPSLAVPIARCFAFVGPHLPLDKHFAIGNFIRDAMQGQPLRIGGDGTPLRSYLYAAELTAWLWTLLFQGQSARAYNIGGEEILSIEQLARRVVAVLGSSSSIELARQAQPGTRPQAYVPDIGRIAIEMDLRALTSLDTAIARTADWARGLTDKCT